MRLPRLVTWDSGAPGAGATARRGAVSHPPRMSARDTEVFARLKEENQRTRKMRDGQRNNGRVHGMACQAQGYAPPEHVPLADVRPSLRSK